MPVGRPTKYKPEHCETAKDLLSQGFSMEALAGQLWVNIDTLYEWSHKHREFSEAIKQGRAAGRLFWEKLGLNGAQGCDDFNATAWIFNMKNRYGWRDKQDITGEGGGPLTVNIVKHADD